MISVRSSPFQKFFNLIFLEGEMLIGIYADYIKILSSSNSFTGLPLKIGTTELSGASSIETGELVVISKCNTNENSNLLRTYVVHVDVCCSFSFSLFRFCFLLSSILYCVSHAIGYREIS
jgi:hypothetical protein